jgi:hypothetical protein
MLVETDVRHDNLVVQKYYFELCQWYEFIQVNMFRKLLYVFLSSGSYDKEDF